MTKKGASSSTAAAKSRKKPKLKKATLKDLQSSGSSKVRGGGAIRTLTYPCCQGTIGCPYSKDGLCKQ
jgi:hypothetical protein